MLVRLVGGHPAAALGIDLTPGPSGGDTELWRWLVAAGLLSDRLGRKRTGAALGALERAGCGSAAALAAAEPTAVAAALAAGDHPRAERRAAQLARHARELGERYAGSLERLAAESADLEELGDRLSALGPGLGAATVRRFLEPLRERWPAARELPLSPATLAAAHHLGLAADAGAEAATWETLCAAVAGAPEAPSPTDFEAALSHLGARACLRDRRDRCPLGGDAPCELAPSPEGDG